jgi:hypothetical protein
MKVSNIECTLKNYISTTVVCGSYMYESSVGKDVKNNMDITTEVAVGKVATHKRLYMGSKVHQDGCHFG